MPIDRTGRPPPAIQPCLWFSTEAEAAVDFYVSVFPRSRVLERTHYAGDGHLPAGTVLTLDFELAGQPFTALNGGVAMAHTPALSLRVTVADQAEADAVFDRLSAFPEQEQCGWLVDRHGVSWQVVPQGLLPLLKQGTAVQRQRLAAAVMGMRRLHLPTLQQAFGTA
jgi:predicted 3-demethylubiquinone-9 3-methyltransferase (glyoxalase superfamily)